MGSPGICRESLRKWRNRRRASSGKFSCPFPWQWPSAGTTSSTGSGGAPSPSPESASAWRSSATSSDGLTFTYEGVAYSGGAVPDVFYVEDTYYLFTAGIDISTSTDGVSFTQAPHRFQSTSGSVTADPSVIMLDDGSYMMLYKTTDIT